MRPTETGARGGDWWTPASLFDALHDELRFTIDGAADAESALLDRWWGPGGLEDDALSADWSGERVFVNPPFRIARRFVEKASAFEADEATLIVPASIDSRWWDRFVLRTATWVRMIPGRIAFDKPGGDPSSQAVPGPMMVAHWRRGHAPGHVVIHWAWTWPGQPRGRYTWEPGDTVRTVVA